MKRHVVIRVSGTDVSWRVPRRAAIATAGLVLALLAAVCLATAFGVYRESVWSVVEAIFGAGNRLNVVVIQDLRLPRILEGLAVGAALGLSGAIFQALSRNPLASPDILGVNEGAAVVAIWMIIANVPENLVPVGAFGGALAVIAMLALFGVRRHFSIYRLILAGLAINALAGAAVAYSITRPAPLGRTLAAQQWLLGDLTQSNWSSVRDLAIGLAVLMPAAVILGRQLNAFQLGDDLATSLGVRFKSFQLTIAGIGAFLAAAAVAFAGPVGFVAFISPHIARRLARTSGAAALPAAAAVGALLVVAADYVAQRIDQPTDIPVGIMTVLLGAPYLLFLLYRSERDTGVA